MKIHKLLIIFFPTILLSGCSSFSKKENIFKVLFSSVRIDPFSTIDEKGFVPSVSWKIFIGNGAEHFYSSLHPAYLDGSRVVYAADRKGIIKAVNIDNGEEIWETDLSEKNRLFSYTPALLSGGVTVYNDCVYVGSEKAKVYALNNKDGSIVWKTNVSGEVLSRPIVADGIVLVHTGNGYLQAINEKNGIVKWMLELDVPLRLLSLRGESTPATSRGIAVVGDKNGKISAILIQEGKIIWQQRISCSIGNREIDRLSDINATPIIINNIVYAIAYNGDLVALDLYNGRIIWRCEVGSVNDFIIEENCIYLSDQDGRILAIDSNDGLILWKKEFQLHHFFTAPIFHRGMLIIGDQEGYMFWLNPQNGCCVAKKKINISGFISNPIIAEDKILIQTKEGMLYAIVC